MAMISSNSFGSSFFGNELEPDAQFMLRRLFTAISPPTDYPRIACVITGALISIRAFGSLLTCPNDVFIDLQKNLQTLSDVVQHMAVLEADELAEPLFRRLSKYPSWALFLAIQRFPQNHDLLQEAGRELALAVNEDRPFSKSFAKNLRLVHATDKSGASTLKSKVSAEKYESIIGPIARAAFESSPQTEVGIEIESIFEVDARQYIVRKLVYSSPRHRQGVLDRYCQSADQIHLTANELKNAATDGNQDAILVCLAFCCGLSLELARRLPLQHAAIDDWFMVLDLETGTIKTNLESLTPNHAVPSDESRSAYRGANKIGVKPLPTFLSNLLLSARDKNPAACNTHDLLTESKGEFQLQGHPESAIAPTVSRLLNSAAPLAIQIDIDRLIASFVTNDFSIVPSSKLYYGLVERAEIWEGSQKLFEYLGWGEPVALVDGLAAGSLVVPTKEAIASLFRWMAEQVSLLKPGRRSTLETLVNHHNAFSVYCTSLAVLCLACREAKEYQFMAHSLHGDIPFVPFQDKWCGQFPGALPLPVNVILGMQLRLWNAHCRALASRLTKFDFAGQSNLIEYIDQVISHQPVKLFFQINDSKSQPLGSADLLARWPADLRLNENFSRSFWDRELQVGGMESSKIDMMLRHTLLGVEPCTSTSTIIQNEWGREICSIQEALLNSLSIRPIAGLTKHQGGKNA